MQPHPAPSALSEQPVARVLAPLSELGAASGVQPRRALRAGCRGCRPGTFSSRCGGVVGRNSSACFRGSHGVRLHCLTFSGQSRRPIFIVARCENDPTLHLLLQYLVSCIMFSGPTHVGCLTKSMAMYAGMVCGRPRNLIAWVTLQTSHESADSSVLFSQARQRHGRQPKPPRRF